ncbi:O-antigen ligase family protein [Aeromonas jandaei]|uniref:O-antigen ligase family protein n=1 Tax=Aeromonas jandaei TaxID=650 RepID=UPI00191F835A|nr:O-antigen ligase family protein [Aeromonas jandaei]MBL0599700.1 O-antigen ligase family protein [Aeromonas jandaei]
MHDKSLNWYGNIYYVLPLIVASCLSFNTIEGKHYISKLVVLMLFIGLIFSRNVLKDNLENLEIRQIMIFWFAISLLLYLFVIFRGESSSSARTILVSLIYISVVPWRKITKKVVLLAVISGGVAAGVASIYEHIFLGITKVGGIVNEIPFATYVAITLIISVNTYNIYQNRLIKFIYLISMLGSIYAIVMSEVRGVWLALMSVGICYLLSKIAQLAVKKLILISISFLLLIAVFASFTAIEERVKQTEVEFQEITNGNYDTSIGLRLQLWGAAIDIIKTHPLSGLGTIEYKSKMEEQYQNGLITSKALSFKDSHFHNQFLDSYVRYGILGLVLAVLIFISPVYIFNVMERGIKLSFIGIAILLIVAGLTDVPLMHTGLIYMIVLYPAAIVLSKK